MTATSHIHWNHIHPSLHWGRPVIDSVLNVFGRPHYGISFTDISLSYNLHDRVVREHKVRASHKIHVSYDLRFRDEYVGKLHLHVAHHSVSVEVIPLFDIVETSAPIRLQSYRRGLGKKSRRLSRLGIFKRPGIRKWAVHTANFILENKGQVAAKEVMET